MKKTEILSPVGNMDMFYAALNAGADAVYLSGKKYTARAFAQNFSNEEIKEIVKVAHIYGVKVYITVNTLIYEQEIKECLEYLKFLYEVNVDAIIMQDLGMIKLVRETYPNLEIHASTQFHNHNIEGLKYLKSIGVKRAVLARELSLEEIKSLDVDIEKEIFVYGALCVSYSGCCLASSCLLNRSGNRGMCAGICRLWYELYENENKIKTEGNYLLSPKELNTLSKLREILDSNITSIKIEGRMKSASYVGYVTHLFRRLVDAYYNNEEMNISEKEIINLKKLYNRDFTLGHLFLDKNYKLMNINTPNHQGYPLGEAYPINNKIKIKLTDNVNQGDGIRLPNKKGMIINFLYDENNLLIKSASKNDIVYIDNKVDLKTKGIVLKTLDVALEEEIKDFPKRKVPVNIKIKAILNQPLKATIFDDKQKISATLGIVEKSINAPVLKKEIVERFSKLNDTPYVLKDIDILADDNIFIPVKIMNELRRILVNKLTEAKVQFSKEKIINKYQYPQIKVLNTHTYNFLVQNENQLKYLLNKDVNIYVLDEKLYQKYPKDNIFLVTNRVAFKYPDMKEKNIVANSLSSILKYAKSNQVYSDIYLNVTNSYTLNTLFNLGVKKVSLSIENSYEDIKQIVEEYQHNYKDIPNIDILVYGKVELMVLKHCLLNMFLNKDLKCHVCKNNQKYYLKNPQGQKFPLINRNGNTYVMHYQNIDLINDIPLYQKLGINNFTFNLLDETEKEIEEIFKKIEQIK